MDFEQLERYETELVEYGIATENELQLITDINGFNESVLNDVLYCRTGYRDYNQFEMYVKGGNNG